MICCTECFRDQELRGTIRSLGHAGDCPTCGSTETHLYNTEKDTVLTDYFDTLISIYTSARSLPSGYPKAETHLLKDELLGNWRVFSKKLDAAKVYSLVTSICSEKYAEAPDLFDEPVGIAELYNKEYLEQYSILRTNNWEGFVVAVKTQNRFHTNHINTKILEPYCDYIHKPYKKGQLFYRGRISKSATGFQKDEMDAPPCDLTPAGRANAAGIRCLYLANNIDTAIHEVRAEAFDYVTVGTSELQEDISVVDLKSIDEISPFIVPDCTKLAINKEHLNKINEEMGKALRRNDSPLDYVPTQYISDFIKSIQNEGKAQYAGLEYKSTMNAGGFNLAVFDPGLFKCVDIKTYRIRSLSYDKEET